MIEFFSSWAKGIGVTVVIISIIEMLLPNNNSKKYIRMILGIYLIFNIVSPLIKNRDVLNVNNINLCETTISTTAEEVNQTSMNKRIKKLYEQELEKDITKKLKEKGFEVKSCNVATQVSTNENEETKINKIKVSIDKINTTNKIEEKNKESKIVTQIQKIKKIDTNVGENKDEKEKQENKNITKSDIQNIKKFLIDEYGVNENCLEIN
ncbi:MAG: stage III sporulation protein AF [Clostridia bacterium]|nr:stage III sporulation protein AF [Clostridia bacterium]